MDLKLRPFLIGMVTLACALVFNSPAAATRDACGVESYSYSIGPALVKKSARKIAVDASLTGRSTLECPNGHPRDGQVIDVREHAVWSGRFDDTDVVHIKGRSRVEVRGIQDDPFFFDASQMGIKGSGTCAAGSCDVNLRVRGQNSAGDRIVLRELVRLVTADHPSVSEYRVTGGRIEVGPGF